MALTEGQIGFGFHVAYGDGASPEVFTDVAEVFSVTEVGAEHPLVEFTHTDSPNRTEEYLHGVKDGMVVTVQCNHVPGNATQLQVVADEVGEDRRNWQVRLPSDTRTYTFAGLVVKQGVTPDLKGRIVFAFDIKITGHISES